MKQSHIFTTLILSGALFASCSKSSDSGNAEAFTTVETDVMTSFVNSTALPQYNNLVTSGTSLNSAITALTTSPTAANLTAAQTAWKQMRQNWERCEGFLIGPVEGNDYDPNSDTWPTDYHQMDSLLASSNSLSPDDVKNLPQTLRGYHPIEYLIFGEGGTRNAADLTTKMKTYLTSLSADLLNNNVTPLLNSWQGSTGYGQTVLNAGASGNATYTSKQAFFLDITGDNGMAGICNEVGQQNEDGKIYNPYISKDSSLSESPYSHNSLVDFKNNIIGAQQVYLGLNGAKGMKDLVAAKSTSLDNQIQAAFTSAINSFDNISGSDNMTFEVAIFNRRTQIAATIAQLNALQELLDTDLINFIKQYVKD